MTTPGWYAQGPGISAGAGVPTAPAADRNLYLNTDNSDLYRRESGAWVLIDNLTPTISGIDGGTP